jgi:ABC-type antimicrobial peptide transport system permease subunit
MLVRLRPEVNPAAFISRLTLPGDINAGNQSLAYLETYTDYEKDRIGNNEYTIVFSIMGIFIALLLLNVVLGTLGTFWLQIRKRTEDIGIMRSFGAKRRHIFAMLWKEAALLTFIAAVIGQVIWLQFAMNVGLADGFSRSVSGQEEDWVNTFWLHFLIVCAIQYVLLLIIVTLGMVVPTVIAMYKRPVEALRHE